MPQRIITTISTLLFLVVGGVLPWVAWQQFGAPLEWLFSCLILSISFVLAARVFRNKRVLFAIVVLVQLINSAYFFSYFLQGQGFNQRFFYHLRLDLLMGGVSEFFWLLLGLCALLIASVGTLWPQCRKKETVFNGAKYGLVTTSIIGVIFYGPLLDTATYVKNTFVVSKENARQLSIARKILDKPEISLHSHKENKNIVLLYMESVESSFFDENYYPGLFPELSKIKAQSFDFANVKQADAASWTISGIVASLCSLPLHSPFSSGRNTLSPTDNFMTGARCLSDLLVENGYVAHYLGGANSEFAGKKSFLNAHGYRSVQGLKELQQKTKDKSYKHGWGLYDDTVYDFAWSEFKELNRQKAPFLLTMLTLDTHHPTGHMSKSCSPYRKDGVDSNGHSGSGSVGSGGGGEGNSGESVRKEGIDSKQRTMLNALHCADQLASNFIKKIRASEYSKNTTIVVVSDHLAMRNVIWKKITQYPKDRNINFFINFPDQKSDRILNVGTQFDIAPTIIKAMDIAEITEPFPLGRSLTEGKGALYEYGVDINFGSQALVRDQVLSLWDRKLGNLKNGFSIGRDGNLLKVNGNVISLKSDGWDGRAASLLTINPESGEIEDVQIWPHHAKLSKSEIPRIIVENPDKMFLAIGKYAYLKRLDLVKSGKFMKDKRVYFFGSSGSAGNLLEAAPVRTWERVRQKAIDLKFDMVKKSDNATLDAYRDSLIGEDGRARVALMSEFERSTLGLKSYELKSCGYNVCESSIRLNNFKETLGRGLTFFGITEGGEVKRLSYVDGCKGGAFSEQNGFESIRKKYDAYSTWVAVSHDTVGCTQSLSRVKNWVGKSGLKKLSSIKFREPYIGLYNFKKNTYFEIAGDDDDIIHLNPSLGDSFAMP